MGEWKEYKLYEVIEKFIDYRGKTPTKTDSGIPLITAKVVKDGRILEPNEFIAHDKYEEWMTRGYPEINDVVLTTEAPLGEVALLKDKNVALAQRIITLRGKKGVCDNAFLKYYFQSNVGQSLLWSRAQGSTVEGIKSAELKQLEITLPELPEQQAIASVLSSLDDKIELLHRQNRTLEALAETLFRQWFMEEVEGSGSVRLGSVVQTTSGGTPSRENPEFYLNGNIRWVKSKELQGAYIFETEESITEEALHNSSAKPLPVNTVLIAMYGATVGQFGILAEPATCNQAVCALMPNESYPYTYLFIFTKLNKDYIVGLAGGSAQQNINQMLIKELEISANQELIMNYHFQVEPYFQKIKSNSLQIRTLTQLRDTLLPKLMSGAVRVECAATEINAVGVASL